TTTGKALDVENTTIGASGLTFRSIAANGAVNGIFLNNTGVSGGLTVTGNGSADTGGTIQNTTNSGIEASSTAFLNLTFMKLANNGNAVNEGGIRLTNITGPSNITSPNISGSAEDGIYLSNTTGSSGKIAIQGPSCAIANNSATTGNDGVNILAAGTAVMGTA